MKIACKNVFKIPDITLYNSWENRLLPSICIKLFCILLLTVFTEQISKVWHISVLRCDWKTTKMHRFLGEDAKQLN